MHLRLLVSVSALAVALVFTGCGRSTKEQAKTTPPPPAPAPVAPAPAPEAPKAGAKPGPKLEELASARIEGGYITVLYKNGRKGLFPVVDLSDADIEAMKAFAAANP